MGRFNPPKLPMRMVGTQSVGRQLAAKLTPPSRNEWSFLPAASSFVLSPLNEGRKEGREEREGERQIAESHFINSSLNG